MKCGPMPPPPHGGTSHASETSSLRLSSHIWQSGVAPHSQAPYRMHRAALRLQITELYVGGSTAASPLGPADQYGLEPRRGPGLQLQGPQQQWPAMPRVQQPGPSGVPVLCACPWGLCSCIWWPPPTQTGRSGCVQPNNTLSALLADFAPHHLFRLPSHHFLLQAGSRLYPPHGSRVLPGPGSYYHQPRLPPPLSPPGLGQP